MMKDKKAFTLAELMITIGIIGVVAAITIPLLIQNSNYKKFTTQFRKSLSTLNQAAISAQAQYDMDYGTLTSGSSASTCATDSLSGGQSTMCALLNNTLAGKTYMGVYGEVAGSMILTKYKFTKKTDGFDPANFLIYSMADGSIVGFNPSMKNCSLSGELTKSVLTDSNKLANCIGFIDVNGVSLPNKEVTCSDGTSALEPNNPCTLKSNGFGLGDVFPVVFHNGTVEPATNAAKAFFSGESGIIPEKDAVEIQVGVSASGEPIMIPRYKLSYGNRYEYDSANGSYVRINANGKKMYLASNGKEYEHRIIAYNGKEYIQLNDAWYRINSTGDLVANYAYNNITKRSDAYYDGPNGAIYDENLNILGKTYNGEWYDYKRGNQYNYYIREDASGNYVDTVGQIYTKNAEGNYELVSSYYGGKIIYDKDMNTLGLLKNGDFYEAKESGSQSLFVKKDADGNYVRHNGYVYTKNSDGNYQRSSVVYDANMNLLGKTYNGEWYEYKHGSSNLVYVKSDANGNYIDMNNRMYTKVSDRLYECNGTLYDENLRIITLDP